jgi:hypothetical protein
VELLHRMGIETGIDGAKIKAAGEFARSLSAYYGKGEHAK